MNYRWNIMSKATDIKEVLSSIATWKNIPRDKIREFIDFKMEPHNPYLLTNMDKAINRINEAIKNDERILIIGDYDADGITGTSVMYIGLRSLFTNVLWRVPNRFTDGYGMNNKMVDEAVEKGCKLIITVDNGIAAHNVIKYANSKGIDVIVTDHHEFTADELPTEITVDPQIDDAYPFKSICGCMVAFKLINALIPDLEYVNPALYEELLSIATIGTIADVMELTDENRFYVKQGLKLLSRPRNTGLRSLMQKLGLYDKEINSDDIGFAIGPCLNATGRLESPDLAVNLLLTDDVKETDTMAAKIVKLNEERKKKQKEALDSLTVNEDDRFIVAVMEDVGHGLLGIIAGQIAEKYQKPCFVLGGSEDKDRLSGSGRSVYQYNINSCIQDNKDIASGGGHSAACGVSIKASDLEEFKKRCNQHFENWLSEATVDDLTPCIDVVSEIGLDLIDERLINNIDKLKPYGAGNQVPIFAATKLKVTDFKVVGKNQNVLQMKLKKGFKEVKAVGFSNIKTKFEELGNPLDVDVLFVAELNEWPEGKFTPQLMIKDIRITNKE